MGINRENKEALVKTLLKQLPSFLAKFYLTAFLFQ